MIKVKPGDNCSLAGIGIAEGLAQWLRSLPPNPEVPGSIPGLVEG